MTKTDGRRAARVVDACLTLALALVFAGLTVAILSLPVAPVGLCDAVTAELDCSGVANPVTAVLLNFRGYDTLLEMGVLLLAVIATWAIRRGTVPEPADPGAVLSILSGVQVPAMILIAGYLLWAGADAPGGAFQAGAILASAGIMLWLAGRHRPGQLRGLPLRAGLVIGLLLFLVIGTFGALGGASFLALPPESATVLTVLLEIAAFVSIGLLLFDMFTSVLHARRPGVEEPAAEDWDP